MHYIKAWGHWVGGQAASIPSNQQCSVTLGVMQILMMIAGEAVATGRSTKPSSTIQLSRQRPRQINCFWGFSQEVTVYYNRPQTPNRRSPTRAWNTWPDAQYIDDPLLLKCWLNNTRSFLYLVPSLLKTRSYFVGRAQALVIRWYILQELRWVLFGVPSNPMRHSTTRWSLTYTAERILLDGAILFVTSFKFSDMVLNCIHVTYFRFGIFAFY